MEIPVRVECIAKVSRSSEYVRIVGIYVVGEQKPRLAIVPLGLVDHSSVTAKPLAYDTGRR